MLEDLTGEDLDIEEAFEDLIDEIDGGSEVTLSIFTKGSITAAIRLTNEDGDQYYEIQLQGGDYLAQNVEVVYNDDGDEETVFTISGKTKGDVQTTTIEDEDGNFSLEYSFNRKTGEFEMTMEEYGYEEYSCEATITFDKNSYTIDFDTLSVGGDELPFDKYIITYSTKPEIVKPKGEEFDLGAADEDDFEDLGEEILEELEDNDELIELLEDLDIDFDDLMYSMYY